MKTKSIISTIAIFTGILLCQGCSREEEELDPCRKYCGDYFLEKIHWSGTSKDLNGDLTGHWSLINEYVNIYGFNNNMNTANVQSTKITPDLFLFRSEYDPIAFNINVPYPDYYIKNDRYHVKGINYLPVTLYGLYHNGKFETTSINMPHMHDYQELFNALIEEIKITDITEDTFTIRIHCTLYDDGLPSNSSSSADRNYMYLTYIR